MATLDPVAEQLIRDSADRAGLSLETAAANRLLDYVDLLQRWNRRIRLVGSRESSEIITVHLMDSFAWAARLRLRLPASNAASPQIIDVGTGAGLPGAVLSAVDPELPVALCDASEKRVSFLQELKRRLKLDFAVHHCPVERLIQAGHRYQHAVSRATFPVPTWRRLGSALLEKSGVLWYLLTANQAQVYPQRGEQYAYRLSDGRQRVIWAEEV